jgi:hypothetical protein
VRSKKYAETALALAIATPLLAWSQPASPMTDRQIRVLTAVVQSARHVDHNDMVLDLDARVRARWGDFESFPVSIVRQDKLSVVLTTPFLRYRRTLAEYLKIDRPLADIPWIDGVVVSVEPLRIDAPDITAVTIDRGGQKVSPIESRLRPMTFANGNGEQATIHAGDVRFPLSAVAPGARVAVSVVPAAGAAMVVALDEAQLQLLK